MSNRANPVASTAAMLMDRARTVVTVESGIGDYEESLSNASVQEIASLASDLHRLAPACKRHAEAQRNGEWRDGQREQCNRGQMQELEAGIEHYGTRLDKRVAKLNALLAPLALEAVRTGDPRGWTLRLMSTDKSRPVPRNGFDSEAWGIGQTTVPLKGAP